MKAFRYLLLLVVATVTTAAPLTSSPKDTSPANPILEARNRLEARKYCSETGITCYYENNVCYWHSCHHCSCEEQIDDLSAGTFSNKLLRRNCAFKINTDCPEYNF
ncbi:hypothetical protein Ptr902_12205 [Pyrenophora tritici-repentis]|nr:hypothetical protein Ptr902_12205 [Pyrenophora tritici-repentis]